MGVGISSPEMSASSKLSSVPVVPDTTPDIVKLEQTVGNLKQGESQINQNANLNTKDDSLKADGSNIIDNNQVKITTEGVNQKTGGVSPTEESPVAGVETQTEKDLQNDPLYQKCLGEVTANAIGKGEPLDGKKLQEEASVKYQQERAKEPAEENAEKQTLDQKMEEAAKRIGTLLENNKENLESAMVTVSAADLAILLKALAEAKEPNPKKKETKLQLVLKLLGVLVLSGAMETVKTVVPPTSQN